MDKVLFKLDILAKKNYISKWVNKDKDLYRFFFNKQMYQLAYTNLKKNKIFFNKVTENLIVESCLEKIIQEICKQMKTETFHFTTMTKNNNLFISENKKLYKQQSLKNELVQEIIRILLQQIWGNNFIQKCSVYSTLSHENKKTSFLQTRFQFTCTQTKPCEALPRFVASTNQIFPLSSRTKHNCFGIPVFSRKKFGWFPNFGESKVSEDYPPKGFFFPEGISNQVSETNPRSLGKSHISNNFTTKTRKKDVLYTLNQNKHTVLKSVEEKFVNVDWLIESQIKPSYDTINYYILLKLLEKRIQPGRFLRLIQKNLDFLNDFNKVNDYSKVGLSTRYCQEKSSIVYGNTKSTEKTINSLNNLPILTKKKDCLPIVESNFLFKQTILSSTLLNIYFHELDLFILDIANKIKNKYTQVNKPKQVFEYFKKTKVERFKFNKIKPIGIEYIRYKNYWLLGITGDKNLIINIKNIIQDFLLNNLSLELNQEKTKIIDLKTQKFFFLGYNIYNNFIVSKTKNFNCKTKNSLVNSLSFLAPIKTILKKLEKQGFCNSKNFPISKKNWVIYQDDRILKNYNILLKQLLGYYSGANNQHSLRNIQYILKYSCAMTLAQKHKTNVTTIMKKYGNNIVIKKNHRSICLYLPVLNKKTRKWNEKLVFNFLSIADGNT